MAHLNWHGKIVRTWSNNVNSIRYYLTETGWLLRTSGPRGGSCKVIAKPKQTELKDKFFHRFSDANIWKSELNHENI